MDIQSILIIALVCVTIGYFAGMLVANLKTDKDDTQAKSAPDIEESPEIEVARLIRENAAANISVKMEDKLFQKPADLNAGQRKVLEEALVEVLRWLGYSPMSGQPLAETISGSTDTALIQQVSPAITEPSMVPLSRTVNSGAATITPPKATPAPPVIQHKSIASQINDILQERLAGTPLEDRRISLIETLTGGVIFKVGMDQYQGIDEVPDREIRDLLKACVAEWERSAH